MNAILMRSVELLPKSQQQAFTAIMELLDRDARHRAIALQAFEKTVIKRRANIGEIIFKTLPVEIQAKVQLVCQPFHVSFTG